MTHIYRMEPGRPYPMGATHDGTGVNFAVFSAHADAIHVCLFNADGREVLRLPLPERDGDIWFGRIDGLPVGTQYGLRAEGPYAPMHGHRFNPNKLLLDPYAKALAGQLIWDDALMGHRVHDPRSDLSYDTRDSAPFMPRAVVTGPPTADWPDTRPDIPWQDTVIYEAHVKGLTMQMPGVPTPGTFAALGSDPVIDHLTRLGITAIELLPVHSFITDAFLQGKGMENYWGYQTLGFFAPHPPFLHSGRTEEVQQAVARLHSAGIEVILDVVYNHTCEGNETGPTLSFRGLDNASYYRLEHGRGYVNDTGTGNTVDMSHPMVMRLVMDSLRHWVDHYHIDGFRFDLGATLGRMRHGFDRDAAFFQALRQDPVLNRVKLIAEPWDIGPGGYQLGAFPPPFAEWNDRFRDTTRRVWRGDAEHLPAMAAVLMGSAEQFDHSGRPATASVNFLTAHDGFTLSDVTSYNERHNAENGEGGRDGHGDNLSDNMGHEGPTDDPGLMAARALRARNMMATLLLSQGVPMILAGDEIANSQGGNNNAYAMDNPTGWIDWAAADWAFRDVVADLIALRKTQPALRQSRFLHSEMRHDGTRNLIWWHPEGHEMTPEDWDDPTQTNVIVELRMAEGDPHTCLIVLATGADPVDVVLPGGTWRRLLDTTHPGAAPVDAGPRITLSAPCVAFFAQDDGDAV